MLANHAINCLAMHTSIGPRLFQNAPFIFYTEGVNASQQLEVWMSCQQSFQAAQHVMYSTFWPESLQDGIREYFVLNRYNV